MKCVLLQSELITFLFPCWLIVIDEIMYICDYNDVFMKELFCINVQQLSSEADYFPQNSGICLRVSKSVQYHDSGRALVEQLSSLKFNSGSRYTRIIMH